MSVYPSQSDAQRGKWERIVVPTCAALHSFFWKLAWFTVFVWLLTRSPMVTYQRPEPLEYKAAPTEPLTVPAK